MPEISLELVDIIRAFPTASLIIAIDRICLIPPGAYAESERILGPHGAVVFGVTLNGEVEDRVFVLML